MLKKINIKEKFDLVKNYWDPKIIAQLNNQHIKVVKLKGEFDWHHHRDEDEMFLVIKGSMEMRFKDKTEIIQQGEMIIIPRGIEHCPAAEKEVQVLLFEPASTINTGNIQSDKTKTKLEFI